MDSNMNPHHDGAWSAKKNIFWWMEHFGLVSSQKTELLLWRSFCNTQKYWLIMLYI